jgi:hypothetical protein
VEVVAATAISGRGGAAQMRSSAHTKSGLYAASTLVIAITQLPIGGLQLQLIAPKCHVQMYAARSIFAPLRRFAVLIRIASRYVKTQLPDQETLC